MPRLVSRYMPRPMMAPPRTGKILYRPVRVVTCPATIHSFTADYFVEIDDLVDWAKDQPRTDQTRREILHRYVGIVLGGSEVFRFLHQNQASVQAMQAGKDRFARFRGRLDALVDVLAGPDAPLRDRVRATASLLSVGATYMFYLPQVDDPDQLGAIILELATELIS